MTGKFITIDLEIFADRPLKVLKRDFEGLGAIYHYCGKISSGYLLTLAKTPVRQPTLERQIVTMCRLVERLSPKGRKIWDAAKDRSFDIGIEAVDEHQAARFSVPANLLQRIADLGGTLTVTVYAPETYPK